MKTQAKASVARQAAKAVCLGISLCLAQAAFAGQHGGSGGHGGGGGHSAPASHGQSQSRPPAQSHAQPGARPGGGAGQSQRPQAGYGGSPARPAYNGSPYSVRANPRAAGHLPDWMAQHRNLPVGQQERLLRSEPGFNRLNPMEQQREVQELHQLNQLPEAQRERRMARNEAMERLSPGEQRQVIQASQDERMLAPDRKAIVRHAFQDLRGVPVDQRDTMLNSARYSATFTPQERGILSNLLRVEPYQQPQ